jgi:drug/metabolite transporter (DMT)-like permease
MVLVYAVMNYTFLNALTLTNEANAIWLQHTAPVWVFLVGVLVFREEVHPRDWWLLTCCVAGVGVILSCEVRGQSLTGVVYGLLGGLTYAGVVLSLRHLRHEDGAWLVMLNNLVTAVLFVPFVCYWNLWPTAEQTLYLAAFGMFQMGLPYLLFAHGVRRIAGHEASGIVLLEPILVPVWVFVAWGHLSSYQSPRWWTMVGGGLILCGLLLRYVGVRRRRQADP